MENASAVGVTQLNCTRQESWRKSLGKAQPTIFHATQPKVRTESAFSPKDIPLTMNKRKSNSSDASPKFQFKPLYNCECPNLL